MIKRLKLEVKQDIFKHIERELASPESNEVKTEMLRLWVVGLIETSGNYPHWFVKNEEEQCLTKG